MPLIQVKKVLKSYTNVLALADVSLEIEKGDIFGIIGTSGAGKSTLIRSLASLEFPDQGEILFEGERIHRNNPRSLRAYRQKIGMIFQHFNLLSSRTVLENICYPLEIRGLSKQECLNRADEVLGLVGLESKRDVYPAFLSGGQKQRVGIARALSAHPHVLFCDEATSALDPQTTKEILALLKMLNQKLQLTIVLITHEMEVIKQICNQVAVIEKGEIVERGKVSQVFADPQHLRTKQFLQNTVHEIPPSFFQDSSKDRTLIRLSFKGGKGSEPVISQMVKRCDVDANILLGWLDSLDGLMIGNLVIELSGAPGNQQKALSFLQDNSVHYEVITHGT